MSLCHYAIILWYLPIRKVKQVESIFVSGSRKGAHLSLISALCRISELEFVPEPEEVVNRKAIELEEQETLNRAERRMLALLSLEYSIASKDKALEHKKKLGDKALEEVRM